MNIFYTTRRWDEDHDDYTVEAIEINADGEWIGQTAYELPSNKFDQDEELDESVVLENQISSRDCSDLYQS